VDPIDMLLEELKEIKDEKEGEALKKNLLVKHGQAIFQKVGMKRTTDQIDDYDYRYDEGQNKRIRYAEDFEDINEIFALHH
jgi:hypothetical protein